MTTFHSSWFWLGLICVAVMLVVTGWGFALLRSWPGLRIGRAPAVFFCESLLFGFFIFSLAAFGGVLLGVRLQQTFLLGTVIAAVIGLTFARKPLVHAALLNQPPLSTRDQRRFGLALLLIVVGSLLWSMNNLRGLVPTADGAILVPWVDFFFHARLIGTFAHYRGDIGTLNPFMLGEPVAPYHYGSYMLSALVADLGDISSIQVATSLYPVLGMLLSGAAMLVLAQVTAGAGGAMLAVLLLFFLPDPSSWMPTPGTMRFNSYFFFQQVGVGGAYAVAVMGLALAYSMRAFQLQSRLMCIGAVCLFAVGGFFKLQLFLAYSLFFILLVIWNAPRTSIRLRLASAVAVVGLYWLVASLLGQVPLAPTLTLSSLGLRAYLEPMLRMIHSGYAPLPLTLAMLPVAPTHLFIVTYGVLLPVVAWLAWRLRKDPAMRQTVSLLILTLAGHACVRLLVADNRGIGDVGEINRKTLVWPYFVVVFCTAALMWNYISSKISAPTQIKWLPIALAGGMLGFSAFSAHRLQAWPETIGSYTRVGIPAGLLASAAYLRRESSPSDVVQLCNNDKYNELATLSERPVYIAKLMVNASPETATERARFAAVANILQQDDFKHASDLLRTAGISWLLMSPACQARWDTQVAPVFSASGFRLYRSLY